MRDIGIPSRLRAVGYTERDAPALIEGTLTQPRLLAGALRSVGAAELDGMRDAMAYWQPGRSLPSALDRGLLAETGWRRRAGRADPGPVGSSTK